MISAAVCIQIWMQAWELQRSIYSPPINRPSSPQRCEILQSGDLPCRHRHCWSCSCWGVSVGGLLRTLLSPFIHRWRQLFQVNFQALSSGGVFALPAGLQQTGFYRVLIIDLPPPPFIGTVMWHIITHHDDNTWVTFEDSALENSHLSQPCCNLTNA